MAHCDRNDGSRQNGIVAHLHRTGGSFGRRLFNENQYTKLFTILVKEMRSDLYGKKSEKVNKGLNEIYLISGVLKARPEEDEK